jgi:hypothetical protein
LLHVLGVPPVLYVAVAPPWEESKFTLIAAFTCVDEAMVVPSMVVLLWQT